jgi:SAM-dependent methyltransferase
LAPFLPDHGPVLDLGSGAGHNAAALERSWGRRVIEADFSNLRRTGPGPVLFDGRRLPFADDSFSACILIFVLQYVADPGLLLSEVQRVVRGPILALQSLAAGPSALRFVRRTDEWLGPFGAKAAGRIGFLPPTAIDHGWAVERSFDRESFPRWVAGFGLKAHLLDPGPWPIRFLRHDLFEVTR